MFPNTAATLFACMSEKLQIKISQGLQFSCVIVTLHGNETQHYNTHFLTNFSLSLLYYHSFYLFLCELISAINHSSPTISIGSAEQQFTSQHHYHPILATRNCQPSTDTGLAISAISSPLSTSALFSTSLLFSSYPSRLSFAVLRFSSLVSSHFAPSSPLFPLLCYQFYPCP